MHKKEIILILVVGLLTFGNSLFNGFVGDDEFVISKNDFYKSWSNFPRLFSTDYITKSDDIFNIGEAYSHTGSVAYRPVLSTTFFIDYWIWEKNPFGYHLTNLILHLCNSVLVYFVVFFLIPRRDFACLSAVIFCVHPLKTEAICSIGYRADPLSCFFVLIAFLCYIRYYYFNGLRKKTIFFLSHLFFAMAIFTKESAIVYPALIILFDKLYRKDNVKVIIKNFFSRYWGVLFISLFYIYVYLNVFPNRALGQMHLLGKTLSEHVIVSFQIFMLYLTSFFLPFSVRALPPLYSPPLLNFLGYKIWFIIIAFVLFVYCLRRIFLRNKKMLFFILWFLVSYIPTSNIVPLINPMAYRFMYLPSVGMAVVLAVILEEICLYCGKFTQHKFLSQIVKYGYLIICIGITTSLNSTWKNTYIMAKHMIKDFPDDPRGYLYLGMKQLTAGRVHEAKKTLLQAVELGLEDPRAYHFIGLCMLNDFKQSRPYYEKCISIFPSYGPSFVALGRIYLFERDFEKAAAYLKRGLSLAPRYSAYGYLIQVYLMQNEYDKAKDILEDAQKNLTIESHLQSLSNFFREDIDFTLPIDIGL